VPSVVQPLAGFFYCEIQNIFCNDIYLLSPFLLTFFFIPFSLSIVYMPHMANLPFFFSFLLLQCGYFIVLRSFFILFHCVLCCFLFFFFLSPFGFSNVYPRGTESVFFSKSDNFPSPIIYPGRPIKLKTMRTERASVPTLIRL
jgi:hypothetical protein